MTTIMMMVVTVDRLIVTTKSAGWMGLHAARTIHGSGSKEQESQCNSKGQSVTREKSVTG